MTGNSEPHPKTTGEKRLPGDPEPGELIARMIRVDHAGEYGAIRIYQGQLAVLGRSPEAAVIRHMAAKESDHLDLFAKLMRERRVRPTALAPVWHVAGYALGLATALLGPKAAMAATEAVEEVIDAHYAGQAALLGDDERELRDTIEKFRGDEIEHRDTAISHGAREAPAHALLTAGIKAASKLAIWLSERV
jgi:ubiquinone biosynthesis monooxygenase Coq7